jgi:hypothetical protein
VQESVNRLAARRPLPWEAGLAVRRDWPDGTHEFIGFRADGSPVDQTVERDRWYWRRGPWRPLGWAVVVISLRDFELHAVRYDCRSPDCPGFLSI